MSVSVFVFSSSFVLSITVIFISAVSINPLPVVAVHLILCTPAVISLVEVISSCPTNWGLTPKAALEWIDEKMIPYYPLGVYKDRSAKEAE